jgi:hypothetical protein
MNHWSPTLTQPLNIGEYTKRDLKLGVAVLTKRSSFEDSKLKIVILETVTK